MIFQMDLTPTSPSGPLFFFKSIFQSIQSHKFFSYAQSFIRWKSCNNNKLKPISKSSLEDHIEGKDIGLCGEEVKVVMGKLGIACEPKGGEWFGGEEILGLFDEVEPSLGEVREAFDVFDENRDGFIDETELHRVLCSLGLDGGVIEVEDCKKMISGFDKNGDGLIDLSEFVKLLENCFC